MVMHIITDLDIWEINLNIRQSNPQYMTNPYQNIQLPQPTQAIPNTVIPPTTNKRLCISQDDAMSRQVENNSSYVYFDQNKDIMYEVNTDAWG